MATFKTQHQETNLLHWFPMLAANSWTVTDYHVVFKAQDAVVYIKLSQFSFVDTDLMLFLDLHNSCLNLLPCGIGEFCL